MNVIKNNLILALLALLIFSGCKNDLKLNAPYKEIPIVHALLNPYETRQMIRINKVFLGEGDANQMAKVSDSVNYQPGELTVILKNSLNSKRDTLKEMVVTTAQGAFNVNQRVYYTDTPLEKSGTYTLTIKNNKTKNEFTASADVIGQVSNNQGYGALQPPYAPYLPGATSGYIDYNNPSATSNATPAIIFRPVEEAKVHQVIVRTLYYDVTNGQVGNYDYVDYVFNDPKSTQVISGRTYINVSFKSGDYYTNMGLELSKKQLGDPTGRKVYLIEYIVIASTQEYVDFMEFSKPSLSLNQNKPLYSNFKDKAALGIFTFRSTCIVQKEPGPSFITSFATNSHTCIYKFLDYYNNRQSCR